MPGYTLQPELKKRATLTDNMQTQKTLDIIRPKNKICISNLIFSPPYLIFACVLYNLCAQIAGFNGTQVLLVALSVAGVLVENIGCAGFSL